MRYYYLGIKEPKDKSDMKYEVKAELLQKIIEKYKEMISALKISDWALADKLEYEVAALNAQLKQQNRNEKVKARL